MSEKLPLYGTHTIAHLFNLSERRVQQLAKDGIIPKAQRGKYELVGALRGYIKYLKKRANGSVESTDDFQRERLRLIKAKADEKEHALLKRRLQLIAQGDADSVWQQIIDKTYGAFNPLPDELSKTLGLSSQEKALIEQEFAKVLENIPLPS